jgi:hypothetical protein
LETERSDTDAGRPLCGQRDVGDYHVYEVRRREPTDRRVTDEAVVSLAANLVVQPPKEIPASAQGRGLLPA